VLSENEPNRTLRLRALQPAEWPAVAALIRESTNAWYLNHGKPAIFTGSAESTLLFPQVYEALDPGCCVVAEDAASGTLLGSCFYHPRETHVALGIMNVAPAAFGQGIARRLLAAIVEFAEQRGLPVRLVSSAQNLDSYSLYTRAGFTPQALFQDMILPVPPEGLPLRVLGSEAATQDALPAEHSISQPRPTASKLALRPATREDVPAMVALERALCGIAREKDYRYFLQNDLGCWQTSVAHNEAGELAGFLVSVCHPGSCMLGPGVQRDTATALALIEYALNRRRDWAPVFLVPAAAGELIGELYRWGAKNLELHVLQVRGACPPLRGISMPTFMPETG
jgi:GNAT superfamily N-acetyltransferase